MVDRPLGTLLMCALQGRPMRGEVDAVMCWPNDDPSRRMSHGLGRRLWKSSSALSKA